MEDLEADPLVKILQVISIISGFILLLQLFICYGLYSIYTMVVISTATSNQTSLTTSSAPQTASASVTQSALRTQPTTATILDCPSGMVFIADGDFCIDVYEVTNERYRHCVITLNGDKDETKTKLSCERFYGNSEFDHYPVVWVNWQQADAYCKFFDKRLPTADEWDRAANYPWPSHDEITKYSGPEEVGSIGDVSPDDVHDLAGNVREWVSDTDAQERRIIKGKSFFSTNQDRPSDSENSADGTIGFRCASDAIFSKNRR